MSQDSWEAAGYVVLFTTAPAHRLTADQCMKLYRLRWQIELQFKRWKSLCGFDRMPNFKPETILAWLYAKILAVVLLERLASQQGEVFSPIPREWFEEQGPPAVEDDPIALAAIRMRQSCRRRSQKCFTASDLSLIVSTLSTTSTRDTAGAMLPLGTSTSPKPHTSSKEDRAQLAANAYGGGPEVPEMSASIAHRASDASTATQEGGPIDDSRRAHPLRSGQSETSSVVALSRRRARRRGGSSSSRMLGTPPVCSRLFGGRVLVALVATVALDRGLAERVLAQQRAEAAAEEERFLRVLTVVDGRSGSARAADESPAAA